MVNESKLKGIKKFYCAIEEIWAFLLKKLFVRLKKGEEKFVARIAHN